MPPSCATARWAPPRAPSRRALRRCHCLVRAVRATRSWTRNWHSLPLAWTKKTMFGCPCPGFPVHECIAFTKEGWSSMLQHTFNFAQDDAGGYRIPAQRCTRGAAVNSKHALGPCQARVEQQQLPRRAVRRRSDKRTTRPFFGGAPATACAAGCRARAARSQTRRRCCGGSPRWTFSSACQSRAALALRPRH